MTAYKVLCLTDHMGHSKENSLYAILKQMSSHVNCQEIAVASRSNTKNDPFFFQHNFEDLFVTRVDSDFDYDSCRTELLHSKNKVNPIDYDIIFLRLPRPTTDKFLKSLGSRFNTKCLINHPYGIIMCSTKSVLLNFQNVCPPIKLCHSIEDVDSFANQHDIVLKPLRAYGGNGLIRIKNGVLNDGRSDHPVTSYLQSIEKQLTEEGYLAMKYLKNVNEGDKRLIVVGGEILAASLRLPPKNSWLCNVALGGISVKAEPDLREMEIVKQIEPYLAKQGILIYGVDTLVDDEGERTLSEINALSIGGFPQAEKQTGKPIIKITIDKIFDMQAFTTIDEVTTLSELDLDQIQKGTLNYYWLKLVSDGFGNPISIPLIIAKGIYDGPTLGLTAAIHGNELNGIPVIQRLFTEIDVNELKGTIIGVPVVNVPSFMRKKRRFNDGVDLNHIMPGKKDGNISEIYAYRFVNKLVQHFDYLVDLHTASFGRINSFYIRADMEQEATKELALLQNADIIVHNPPSDGTLRGAADELGIPAITIEVGNPSIFQKRLIRSGIEGIHNVLCHLKMIDDDIELIEKQTILCERSYWVYTDRGGILDINVNLLDSVKEGQKIASIRNIFGEKIKDFNAPGAGIVIGKSVSPVNQSGGRILHLGIIQQ